MKQWKKFLMMLMCTGVVLSATACGSDNNADDNGAVNNETTDNTGDANDTNTGKDNNENGNTNDATDGTDNRDGEGVMDEIGDDLKDGADDVGDAVDGDENRDDINNKNR